MGLSAALLKRLQAFQLGDLSFYRASIAASKSFPLIWKIAAFLIALLLVDYLVSVQGLLRLRIIWQQSTPV